MGAGSATFLEVIFFFAAGFVSGSTDIGALATTDSGLAESDVFFAAVLRTVFFTGSSAGTPACRAAFLGVDFFCTIHYNILHFLPFYSISGGKYTNKINTTMLKKYKSSIWA
jgi:hypothetical protein